MNGKWFCVIIVLVTFLSGCGEKKAEVRFGYKTDQGSITLPELRVTVRNDLHTYDFILNNATRTAGPITTPKFGSMHIACTIFLGGVATNTEGSIELSLKPDWIWGVNFHIQENTPVDVCFGCFGYVEYVLVPALGFGSNMKLWIVWGGNSISNPVNY